MNKNYESVTLLIFRCNSPVDFNDVCNKIWSQDKNRVFLGRHYRVNIQDKINDASSNVDRAHSPLFSYVDRNILNKPTFKAFMGKNQNVKIGGILY